MRADDLGALVRLYNDAVAAIPCNWPLTEAEFADALLGNGTLSSPGRRLDPETVYVAGAAGTPLGFVDFTLTGGAGLIRFLAFPPRRQEWVQHCSRPHSGTCAVRAAPTSRRGG